MNVVGFDVEVLKTGPIGMLVHVPEPNWLTVAVSGSGRFAQAVSGVPIAKTGSGLTMTMAVAEFVQVRLFSTVTVYRRTMVEVTGLGVTVTVCPVGGVRKVVGDHV